eukprot:1091378-Pelagomonas_calceolata.AAC.1
MDWLQRVLLVEGVHEVQKQHVILGALRKDAQGCVDCCGYLRLIYAYAYPLSRNNSQLLECMIQSAHKWDRG